MLYRYLECFTCARERARGLEACRKWNGRRGEIEPQVELVERVRPIRLVEAPDRVGQPTSVGVPGQAQAVGLLLRQSKGSESV